MSGRLKTSYNATTTTPIFIRHITSWILPPFALACIRALISLYIFTTIFVTIGIEISYRWNKAARVSFAFFTVLTYYGLGFYFAVSAFHGFRYASYGRRGLAAGDDSATPVKGGRGVLRWMHGWYYGTITTFPLVVTIVFWALLSKGQLYSPFSTWNNVSEHALNTVFAVFEMSIPRTDPTAWIHLLPAILILCLYLGLTFVNEVINDFYVYPFLDPSKNSHGVIAGYIVGILIGYVIIFGVVRWFIWVRKSVTEGDRGHKGKFSAYDVEHHEARDVEIVTVMRQTAPKQNR